LGFLFYFIFTVLIVVRRKRKPEEELMEKVEESDELQQSKIKMITLLQNYCKENDKPFGSFI
jgi:hypothetical protein